MREGRTVNAIDRLREGIDLLYNFPGGLPVGRSEVHDDARKALAAVEALSQAAKNLRYAPDANGGDVLVAREDWDALAAAVRRVEGE